MKFNMGCGYNHKAGFRNVDASPGCSPDEVWDLEQTPWPWPTNCADEVIFIHSLEHMGQEPKIFLGIMTELYRIARHDCQVIIHVPHPRHDHFIGDPTHVRPITPDMLNLFNRDQNDEWKRLGGANTPLAHYLGVDFVVTETRTLLDEPYRSDLAGGRTTREAVLEALRSRNNVALEFQITLRVKKALLTDD